MNGFKNVGISSGDTIYAGTVTLDTTNPVTVTIPAQSEIPKDGKYLISISNGAASALTVDIYANKLFGSTLTSTKLTTYTAVASVATSEPVQFWLLQKGGTITLTPASTSTAVVGVVVEKV